MVFQWLREILFCAESMLQKESESSSRSIIAFLSGPLAAVHSAFKILGHAMPKLSTAAESG
jgi:hypothetical protein